MYSVLFKFFHSFTFLTHFASFFHIHFRPLASPHLSLSLLWLCVFFCFSVTLLISFQLYWQMTILFGFLFIVTCSIRMNNFPLQRFKNNTKTAHVFICIICIVYATEGDTANCNFENIFYSCLRVCVCVCSVCMYVWCSPMLFFFHFVVFRCCLVVLNKYNEMHFPPVLHSQWETLIGLRDKGRKRKRERERREERKEHYDVGQWWIKQRHTRGWCNENTDWFMTCWETSSIDG